MGRHSQPGSASYLEDLLSHLSEQLCHFTQARMEMADLYEKMHSLGSQKSINSDELVTTLEAVLHKYSSKCVSVFTHYCVCTTEVSGAAVVIISLKNVQDDVLKCLVLSTTQKYSVYCHRGGKK